MTEFESWVEALRGAGCKPVRRGSRWQALCPAHADTNRSLSVTQGDDGKALVHCFAGCTFDQISDKVGRPRARAGVSSVPPVRSELPEPQPLPEGHNVQSWTYHQADGTVLFAVVRRDTKRGKKVTQWTPHGGGWIPKGPPAGAGPKPLYNLADLADLPPDRKIGVVEGEKCADAFHKAWPTAPVTTWAGGTGAWERTDWTPLAGRRVILIADGDGPGHRTMVDLAEHLHRLGCRVDIVLPPKDGSDVFDWLAVGGPGGAADIIQTHMERYHPDGPPHPAAALTTAALETAASNKHYRILGLVGDAVAVWIAAGRVVVRSGESLTQRSTLIRLAPQVWWARVTGQDDKDFILGPHQCAAIGDSLIRYADQQGQVDLSNITGRGAVRLDSGQIVYHLGDRLFAAGETVPLASAVESGRVWVAEPPLPMGDRRASDRQLRQFAEAVMAYRWLTPDDGRRLLGWVVSGLVGGALDWRPHVLLTAPASTGKSWLLRHVVKGIMGPMVTDIADATPAALARQTQSSSLPVLIDEAEPTYPWVQDLLGQLRISAGGEGQRIRSDMATGGVISFRPRYSALLSATVAPRMLKADATRLCQVRLGRAVDDWPAVSAAILAAAKHAEAIRSRVVEEAGRIVAEAAATAVELQGRGVDTRSASASAALTAGWRFWRVDDRVVPAGTSGDESSDAHDALFDILALTVRLGSNTEHSILYLLDGMLSLATISDLYGVRRDSEGVTVAPTHRGLIRALSKSQWANVDLGRLLLQIDGAERTNPLRFANGQRMRSVKIPTRTLERLDIWLTPPETDPRDRHEGAR